MPTEAVEWNELLKGRGKLSIIERQFTPQAHYNDKFQPLLEFLVAKGKPQVFISCKHRQDVEIHKYTRSNSASLGI